MECPKCHSLMKEDENTCMMCGYQKETALKEETSTKAENFSFDFMSGENIEKEIKKEDTTIAPSDENKSYQLDKVTHENGELFTKEDVEEERRQRHLREEKKEMELKKLQEEMEEQEHHYDEYDLLPFYIGKNADKLINEEFSVLSFFFSLIYFSYRKYWSLLFIMIGLWYGILIGNTFLVASFGNMSPIVGYVLLFILQLVIAIKFKKMYVSHCLKKVKRIMTIYKEKKFSEISQICLKKGGTSIFNILLGIVLSVGITFALVTVLSYYNLFELTY